ncbi:unnamed protein product [Microthlaspi erraticum]|uniref:Uncharacterized protein n=1 Tax=Microthlaspi erraticum TaxID=1685480 RepID=A0A6D2IRD8_9BRAS|nr:unnamed protein product [Microthlaspi erraticum]
MAEASKGVSSYAAKEELLRQETSSVKREATGKKPIRAKKRAGASGGLGARKLTTKQDENIYEQSTEESSSSSNSNSGIESSAVSSLTTRFEFEEDLQSGGKSGGGTHVLSHVSSLKPSYEARKRFLNAKSISSAQFFGDSDKYADPDESKPTDEESLLKNNFSLVGNIVGKNLNTLAFAIKDAFLKMSSQDYVLYALRRDVSDLMQRLHGEGADAIPFATRLRWIQDMFRPVIDATIGDNAFRDDQEDYAFRDDQEDLVNALQQICSLIADDD